MNSEDQDNQYPTLYQAPVKYYPDGKIEPYVYQVNSEDDHFDNVGTRDFMPDNSYHISSCAIYSSIVLGVCGVLSFWPLCIIGFFIIRESYIIVMNEDPQNHKKFIVQFAWWFNLLGVMWGLIETIVVIIVVLVKVKVA